MKKRRTSEQEAQKRGERGEAEKGKEGGEREEVGIKKKTGREDSGRPI